MRETCWSDRKTRDAAAIAIVAAAAFAVMSLAGCGQAQGGQQMHVVAGGDPSRGPAAISKYGCGSCHVIPGVDGANGAVGPPLTDFGARSFIAGEVGNTPENLIHWIEVPQSIEPGTAMPNLGVTEGDARNIAAYLYTLH
jgi:cytochrome c1